MEKEGNIDEGGLAGQNHAIQELAEELIKNNKEILAKTKDHIDDIFPKDTGDWKLISKNTELSRNMQREAYNNKQIEDRLIFSGDFQRYHSDLLDRHTEFEGFKNLKNEDSLFDKLTVSKNWHPLLQDFYTEDNCPIALHDYLRGLDNILSYVKEFFSENLNIEEKQKEDFNDALQTTISKIKQSIEKKQEESNLSKEKITEAISKEIINLYFELLKRRLLNAENSFRGLFYPNNYPDSLLRLLKNKNEDSLRQKAANILLLDKKVSFFSVRQDSYISIEGLQRDLFALKASILLFKNDLYKAFSTENKSELLSKSSVVSLFFEDIEALELTDTYSVFEEVRQFTEAFFSNEPSCWKKFRDFCDSKAGIIISQIISLSVAGCGAYFSFSSAAVIGSTTLALQAISGVGGVIDQIETIEKEDNRDLAIVLPIAQALNFVGMTLITAGTINYTETVASSEGDATQSIPGVVIAGIAVAGGGILCLLANSIGNWCCRQPAPKKQVIGALMIGNG